MKYPKYEWNSKFSQSWNRYNTDKQPTEKGPQTMWKGSIKGCIKYSFIFRYYTFNGELCPDEMKADMLIDNREYHTNAGELKRHTMCEST